MAKFIDKNTIARTQGQKAPVLAIEVVRATIAEDTRWFLKRGHKINVIESKPRQENYHANMMHIGAGS